MKGYLLCVLGLLLKHEKPIFVFEAAFGMATVVDDMHQKMGKEHITLLILSTLTAVISSITIACLFRTGRCDFAFWKDVPRGMVLRDYSSVP